jgi:hypothetical protein
MGRRRKLNYKQIETLISDRANGMTPKELEVKYEFGKNSIYDLLKSPDIALKVREERLLKVRDKLFERTQGVTVDAGEDRQGETIYRDIPPDVPAMKLYLEYEEGYNPAQKVDHSGKVEVKLSLTDIQKAIKAAEAEK